ncbi:MULTISPECIES: hypothetical protein [unclassified Brevibacterium]|uniref:hypothetical protein n=1 Tax=unclassified Brevibacterium TaxID=2614124 RepID=UPI0010F6286C|nr:MULTISPECIES: hypothetical protein [unclassified Brevibacterium]MCM1011546.1 hypothetical protein [Brevibacterium sp. XM4083]
MRHDTERSVTHAFLDAPVPAHWQAVVRQLNSSPFTHLSRDDILAEATGLLIVAPSAEVVAAGLGTLLAALDPVPAGFVTVRAAEEVDPADVPAGTWVLLPHRADGWVEAETASAKLHREFVAENTARLRARDDSTGESPRTVGVVVIEYGINLWFWAEPPASGGDPVCHAGELISWESAWTLSDASTTAGARPPILFGLPPVLHRRRATG